MAGVGTPRLFRGIAPGDPPVLQPGSRFTNRPWGLDDGQRSYLVHPQTSKASWPKQGAPDGEYPFMFVLEVEPTDDESGLIKLEVRYRGFTVVSGTKPLKVSPDCDVQMLTIQATTAGAGNANVLVPVPQPRVTTERVTSVQPTFENVAKLVDPAGADFLPAQPEWSITLAPTSTPTVNFLVGWVLQTRGWEEIIPGKVWLVREGYVYYYRLAGT